MWVPCTRSWRIVPLRGESFFERFAKALEDGNSREELRPTLKDLRYHQTLDYALMLLRYHGPGFDERWSSEERVDLIVETCSHINGFVEVLHKLMTFLEHGQTQAAGTGCHQDGRKGHQGRRSQGGRRSYKPSDRTGAVHQYSLRLPDQGDHPTVRKMVRRGRSALVAALGEEGWQAQAQAMKE